MFIAERHKYDYDQRSSFVAQPPAPLFDPTFCRARCPALVQRAMPTFQPGMDLPGITAALAAVSVQKMNAGADVLAGVAAVSVASLIDGPACVVAVRHRCRRCRRCRCSVTACADRACAVDSCAGQDDRCAASTLVCSRRTGRTRRTSSAAWS